MVEEENNEMNENDELIPMEADEENADDEDDNPLAHLPDYVLERIERLRELHERREKIEMEYRKERAALEIKYHKLYGPLYAQRAAIVQGITHTTTSSTEEEVDEPPNVVAPGEERVRGIPQFWLSAMMHEDTISEWILEDDVECLNHLVDVTCVYDDDGKGFELRFVFDENEFFTDTVLTKRYAVPNLWLSDEEPLLKRVEGCEIHWKAGKCLTHKIIKKKQRGKGKNAGQVRTVEKKEETESFFHWFSPPAMPGMSGTDNEQSSPDENRAATQPPPAATNRNPNQPDDLDEEEAERLEEIFDQDYEVATAFRTQLIPKAYLWFTGQDDDADGEVEEAMQELILLANAEQEEGPNPDQE
jgi:nucleosome assembly protein 1-like 1